MVSYTNMVDGVWLGGKRAVNVAAGGLFRPYVSVGFMPVACWQAYVGDRSCRVSQPHVSVKIKQFGPRGWLGGQRRCR